MNNPSSDLEPKSIDESIAVTTTTVAMGVDEHSDELQDLRDFRERWNEAKAEVSQKQAKVDYLKEALKTAKKAFDVAVAELLVFDEEELPLFDNKPSSSSSGKPSKAKAAMNEAWRDLHITELQLSDRTTELLLSASPSAIETIGDLTDFLNDKKGRRYTDIDGIGPAKAQEIDDAMVDFFANHPEYCEKKSEPAEEEAIEEEEEFSDEDEVYAE